MCVLLPSGETRNYISAQKERSRLWDRSPAYEAEMSHHMTLHEDVLERILNVLRQDDYYRTLEDLPVIDELTAYNDIRLFPELYDTSTIIERVTAEADLIKRQLR